MTARPDIIEIDEFNLQEEVIDFSVSSIVMMAFWAPWSKESLKVKKTYKALCQNAEELGDEVNFRRTDLALFDLDPDPANRVIT